MGPQEWLPRGPSRQLHGCEILPHCHQLPPRPSTTAPLSLAHQDSPSMSFLTQDPATCGCPLRPAPFGSWPAVSRTLLEDHTLLQARTTAMTAPNPAPTNPTAPTLRFTTVLAGELVLNSVGNLSPVCLGSFLPTPAVLLGSVWLTRPLLRCVAVWISFSKRYTTEHPCAGYP